MEPKTHSDGRRMWIDVERGMLSPGGVAAITHDEPVFLSPATMAELRFGAEAAADPGVRQERLGGLRRLQHGYRLLTRNRRDFEDNLESTWYLSADRLGGGTMAKIVRRAEPVTYPTPTRGAVR